MTTLEEVTAALETAMVEIDSRRIHWSEMLKTLPPDNGMVGMANMILGQLADATDAAVASLGWRLVDGEWEIPT